MPDYNLGRAHGTIRVDYDGRGVEQADADLNRLGDTSEEAGRKVSESTDRSSADYDKLAAAARRLEQEVARAAAAEISARARAAAAQQHLVQVQNNAASSAQDLLDAQRQLTTETKRYEAAVMRAHTANRALANVNRELSSRRRPDLTPHVDTSKLADILHHLQNVDKSTRKSAFGLNAFSGRLRAMIGILGLASPAVAGLAVSLVSLTGLLGVAAGAVAALAATAGTLVTAFSGMGSIFKAAGQQAASAGSDAVQAASQQRAAARQIQQAIRGVRDAEEGLEQTRRDAARAAVQAAQQVVQAERQLRDAQFDALRAQQNLTRARREAARQLEDLRAQLIGGALDERQAIIDVRRAQEELDQVRSDPRSSQADVEQAILNLERQQQALEDTRRQNQRLQADQAEAAAKGVEGSDQVVDAQNDVLHAQEAMQDAVVSMAEAVVSAAEQQITAQRDVRNATEALLDAQTDLAEAYLSAGESAASAGSKMADAMANVSPEARKLAGAILSQSSAWREVKFAVQDALFAGLSKEVAPLANKWLPILKTGMVGIATELRGLIVALIEFLHRGQTTADVGTIFKNTRAAVHNLIPGIIALLKVFLNLATVGSGFLPKMAEGFSKWATRLAEVNQQSRESGALQSWMQRGIDTLRKLWELLGNVASIIGTIFSAFDQEGGDALTTLVNLTQRLDDFLKSAQGQDILHALGKTLAALAHLVGDILLGAFAAFGPVFVKLAPLIQQFADILGDQILVTFGLLAPVLKVVADILAFLGPVLVPLLASFVLVNKAVGIAIGLWKSLNLVMKANPFLAIVALIIALATFIFENWDAIAAKTTEIWRKIQEITATIWALIKTAIINPIKEAVQAVIDFFQRIADGAKQKWDELVRLTKMAWENIKRWIIDPVREAVESVLQFFRELPSKIAGFFADAGEWLVNAGKNIINGLIDGLRRAAGQVFDFIRDIGSDIGDAFASVLDIFSPSRVFRDFGEFTLEGYIAGLDRLEPDVIGRVIEIASRITNAGQPDQLVPAGAVAVQRVEASPRDDAQTQGKTVVVHTLNLSVTGNLDPTNRVTWRKAIKQIKTDIENVDRSDQP